MDARGWPTGGDNDRREGDGRLGPVRARNGLNGSGDDNQSPLGTGTWCWFMREKLKGVRESLNQAEDGRLAGKMISMRTDHRTSSTTFITSRASSTP